MVVLPLICVCLALLVFAPILLRKWRQGRARAKSNYADFLQGLLYKHPHLALADNGYVECNCPHCPGTFTICLTRDYTCPFCDGAHGLTAAEVHAVSLSSRYLTPAPSTT